MTTSLDTPEQINAWVILSRVHQAELHMKGLKVPGLLKWLKANIPDCANATSVKNAYPALLDYADAEGVLGNHKELCNYQVLATPAKGSVYFDQGIFDSIEDIQNAPGMKAVYDDGRVVILRTMKDVRGPDKKVRMTMQ